MHSPRHACPLPRMPSTTHTTPSHMSPPPCTPPPPWTDFLTHACKNITNFVVGGKYYCSKPFINFQNASGHHCYLIAIITTRKRSLGGEVMFSHLSVILFTGGGLPNTLPGCRPPPPRDADTPTGCRPPPPGCRLPSPQTQTPSIWSTSGRYASYCSAYLL